MWNCSFKMIIMQGVNEAEVGKEVWREGCHSLTARSRQSRCCELELHSQTMGFFHPNSPTLAQTHTHTQHNRGVLSKIVVALLAQYLAPIITLCPLTFRSPASPPWVSGFNFLGCMFFVVWLIAQPLVHVCHMWLACTVVIAYDNKG